MNIFGASSLIHGGTINARTVDSPFFIVRGEKAMEVEMMNVEDLTPYRDNPRNNDTAVRYVKESIENFGFKVPIVVDKHNIVVAGHTRLLAAKALGMAEVPVTKADDLNDDQVKAFRLADNKVSEYADWDLDLLKKELDEIEYVDMESLGFDDSIFDEVEDVPEVKTYDDKKLGSLAEKFIIPPFTILDTRNGKWQDRKRGWLNTGIRSELGRDDDLVFGNHLEMAGTSVFDPVLCEVMYKWLTPHPDSEILDPFAGGSVRGVMAEKTGNRYTGIDLRKEQIDANNANAIEIGVDLDKINWIQGNSLNVDTLVPNKEVDLVFTCPPYFDLEVYSDDPDDISNMNYEDFEDMYSKIIEKSVKKLKNNRFAAVVISDVRDKKGFFRDLTGVTKRAMAKGGAEFYNDLILVNMIGTAALRANLTMTNRKMVRTHQNVLVFFKGNPKQIKDEFEEIVIDAHEFGLEEGFEDE